MTKTLRQLIMVTTFAAAALAQDRLIEHMNPQGTAGLKAAREASAGAPAAAEVQKPLLMWKIRIEGAVGGASFKRSGRLFLTDTLPKLTVKETENGNNAAEMMISSGDPESGQPGAIQYATHTYLLRRVGGLNDLLLDLGYVEGTTDQRGQKLQVKPDARTLPLVLGLNSFSAGNEQAEEPLDIVDGLILAEFTNQAQDVSGTIQITGRGLLTGATTTYTARFTGKVAGLGGVEVDSSTTTSGGGGGGAKR